MAPSWTHGSAINDGVARSLLGYYFRLQGSGHRKEIRGSSFLTEIRAGITTFATMAYIISVNSIVLADSGGICVCHETNDPSCMTDPEYAKCLVGIKRDFVTATAAISCLASVMFGLVTNLPVALAPGMGLNAYFTYQVVGFHGTGPVPYRLALTAVFVEGWIFVGLSLLGIRQWLVKLIPTSLKIASNAGIGLFLALLGLAPRSGLGLISMASNTPLEVAGCPAKYQDSMGVCQSHRMRDPTVWIGIFCGGFLTALMMLYRVKSAMILGIALVCIIVWPRGTSSPTSHRQLQATRPLIFSKSLSGKGGSFALALITFLYVDVLDCTGTLFSMARFSGVVDDRTGSFPRSTIAYCTDAISISIGSLFGMSPTTCFIESGAGISEGGRTGITAITTGICFFISIFFAPITSSIPPYATGSVLVLVGFLMARSIVDINWNYAGDAIPAFVTLIMMPFSYSIAYGLIAGLLTYTFLNGATAIIKFVSRRSLVPVDEELKEYWTWRREYDQSLWFVRLAKHPRSLWDKEATVSGLDMSLYHRDMDSTQRSRTSVSEVPDSKT